MAIHSWKSQYISVWLLFGYDLLCDLLEMLNFNKYWSAVCNSQKPSRSNSVEEYKRPDGLTVRPFDPDGDFFHFIFSIYF
jgi:hypothetical protein